jgi:septum formation topological specificity factor MinE
VGLFDFFKRRRQRESAIPSPSTEVSPLSSQGDEPVVGQQFSSPPSAGAAGELDVSSLSGLAGLADAMKQAAAQGNTQVTQSSPTSPTAHAAFAAKAAHQQSLDLRGTGLREEIVEIMKRHGIDPDSGALQGAQLNAASMPAMQAEMLEALKRHGIDTGGAGIQIDSSQPPQPGQ